MTLLLMGGATVLIGLLPTYATWGVAAPIVLVALRFLQGLGLGGEWGGAVLMSMEHGSAQRRGFNASWPQVGVPLGNLLAAGVLGLAGAVLSEDAFLSWGWRVAFLLSGVLLLVGLWIRTSIPESPLFAEAEAAGRKARMPLIDVIREHPRGLLVAMGARIGTDVAFYTFTLYILTFITQNLGLPRSLGLTAVLVGSACQLALIPFFGALSDRVGRRPVYAAGAVAAALWAFAFFPLLSTGSTALIVLASVVALATHAGDVRAAGGVRRGDVLHPPALQRRVDGLPDRRRARRRDRADRVDRAGRGVRHAVRGLLLRAGDAPDHAAGTRVRARDRAYRPARGASRHRPRAGLTSPQPGGT